MLDENIVGKKPIKIKQEAKKPVKIIVDENVKTETKSNSGFEKKNKKTKILWLMIIPIFLIFIIFIIQKNMPANIEEIKDSVVMITVYDEDDNEISTGSGFCAYKSSYIVTNFHVIEGAYKIKVTTDDNKKIPVKNILIFNKNEDIAILEGDFDLNPLEIGNTSNLKAGDAITAIGSPKGELNTVSTGIISNADNDYEIRITAPISPGSSGGVLLNSNNKVIGITFATYNSDDSQNLNYAISVEYLNKIYNQYKNNEYSILKSSSIGNSSYSVQSIKSFYNYTNKLIVFEKNLSYEWHNIYNNFNKEEKNSIIELYEQIENKNYNFIDINEWEVIDCLINLNILNKQEVALVATDIYQNTTISNVFERVNSYSLDTFEKAVILLLLGGYSPSDLNYVDADNVVKKVNELSLSIEEKGIILKKMGYTVNSDSVTW